MLIVALVLAVIGLAALVTAVVTGNELIAWVCIAASAIGVLLLIVDAIRERSHHDKGDVAADPDADAEQESDFDAEYPDDAPSGEDAPKPAADEPAVTPDGGPDDEGPKDESQERDASTEKGAGGS